MSSHPGHSNVTSQWKKDHYAGQKDHLRSLGDTASYGVAALFVPTIKLPIYRAFAEHSSVLCLITPNSDRIAGKDYIQLGRSVRSRHINLYMHMDQSR